jgi:hypothetical protein
MEVAGFLACAHDALTTASSGRHEEHDDLVNKLYFEVCAYNVRIRAFFAVTGMMAAADTAAEMCGVSSYVQDASIKRRYSNRPLR